MPTVLFLHTESMILKHFTSLLSLALLKYSLDF